MSSPRMKQTAGETGQREIRGWYGDKPTPEAVDEERFQMVLRDCRKTREEALRIEA